MSTFLKVGSKIIFIFLCFIITFIFSFVALTLVFIAISYGLNIDMKMSIRSFQIGSAIILAILHFMVFIWFIARPIPYILKWLYSLSRGELDEPVNEALSKTKPGSSYVFRRATTFLYRDIIEQMYRLTEALKQSKQEQFLLDKQRREWLAGITHDLKTPLSYVQGYANMIASDQYEWTMTEMKAFGGKIEEKSVHIQQLIDDLNMSFQTEDGQVNMQRTATEVVELVRRVVVDIANNPRFSGYDFSYETELDHCNLQVDASLIYRALQNFITNAAIHNSAGTMIQVSVLKRQSVLQIIIEDDGIGMDEITVSQIFQSYYRGTSTDQSEGTGLGMNIAKQLIELHEGTVQVDSILGEGTRFTVSLPIA